MSEYDSGKPRAYVVCTGCGFFYGDLMLYPEQGIDCPECGFDEACAFGKIERALAYQAEEFEVRTHG